VQLASEVLRVVAGASEGRTAREVRDLVDAEPSPTLDAVRRVLRRLAAEGQLRADEGYRWQVVTRKDGTRRRVPHLATIYMVP
jgi:hypothetical protein